MSFRPTTLERAYQLAKSGECATINDIKVRLLAERFDNVASQLSGPVLMADLRRHVVAARGKLAEAV